MWFYPLILKQNKLIILFYAKLTVPVLVIISLSKGNALAIKSAAHTSYNGPPDKGGIIQRSGCLIRYKGIRLTNHYKCLAFDIS